MSKFDRLKQVIFKSDTLPWKIQSTLLDLKEMLVVIFTGVMLIFGFTIVSLVLAMFVLKFGIWGTIGITILIFIITVTLYNLRPVIRYVLKGE